MQAQGAADETEAIVDKQMDIEHSQKFRQQDLLNTLMYTLNELREAGVAVDLLRDRENEWIGIYVHAHWCPICGRLTANSDECSQKAIHEGKQ